MKTELTKFYLEGESVEKIDFVIPWVDSNDLKWQKQRNQQLLNAGIDIDTDAENIGEERYRDYGTLKYLFRSIERYASWVHHIYLITDNQVPNWLRPDTTENSEFYQKLTIIDHKDIMPNEILPSYNSNAIEFNMINIPNLSEQFVAFNDDLLINSEVRPEDFFLNGLPRDYRVYIPLKPFSEYDHILFNNSQLINHWLQGKYESKTGLFSRTYGKQLLRNYQHYYLEHEHYVSNYSFPHNAQSFLKTSFEAANKMWGQEIYQTMQNNFRTNNDLSTLLIRDYQLETGCFVPRSPKFSQYYQLNEIDNIRQELLNSSHNLICINDAETKDYETDAKILNQLLQKKFPEKSSFEI